MDGRRIARYGLATALALAGVAHFVAPRVFVDHLPPQVPGRAALVYATGTVELVLALAVAAAPTRHRRRVGLLAAGYLVAVFPANVYVAVASVPVYPASWLAWARLPLQPLFIWWALYGASGEG